MTLPSLLVEELVSFCVVLFALKLAGTCTMAKYIRKPTTPIIIIPNAATFAIVENSSRVGLLVNVKILRYSLNLRSIAFLEKRLSFRASCGLESLESLDVTPSLFFPSLEGSRGFLGLDEDVPFFLAIVHSPNLSLIHI